MPQVVNKYSKYPIELDEFLHDFSAFQKKWSFPKVCNAIGFTKQAGRLRANKVKPIISKGVTNAYKTGKKPVKEEVSHE